MQKMKKFFMILIVTSMFFLSNISVADVGNFESYDSDWGSSWDSDWSSDWDSDWDSNWDDDYYYDYGSYGGSSLGIGATALTIIIFVVMVVVILVVSSSKPQTSYSNIPRTNYHNNYPNRENYSNRTYYNRNQARSESVANEVRRIDKFFNDEQFLAFVKNTFIKLQTAWSNRDWEIIRTIESESLYEQHSRQVQEYINKKQINKIERIGINFAELVSFAQDNEKDILVVALNSSMLDYIVDERSGMILKGSRDNRLTNTYKLTFIRKKGVITESGTAETKTTNCPNCGAPTNITSSGKCEFCGSVITIGTHGWVLSGMTRL